MKLILYAIWLLIFGIAEQYLEMSVDTAIMFALSCAMMLIGAVVKDNKEK